MAQARPPEAQRGDTLVVAGLWVRAMAESARRAGWRVIALDLFGDLDTRRAAAAWAPIGDAAAMAVDPVRLERALRRAASEPRVLGWVAGSGFEAAPEGLDTAADVLPRFGIGTDAMRRLRDPRAFFAQLDALGVPHPPVAFGPVADAAGWLVKQAGGSGGWHVRPALAGAALAVGEYLQRRVAGEPRSLLFLADGARAMVVGQSRQQVRELAGLPYVYAGAIGPVHDDATQAEAERTLARLVPAFGLRGLGSLDLIATPDGPSVLEINARPSATMVLYDDLLPRGLMHAHVMAVRGQLPAALRRASDLRGHRIVYADAPLTVSPALAARLAATPHLHDLPQPGQRIGAGEPLCSVSARSHDEASLLAALQRPLPLADAPARAATALA